MLIRSDAEIVQSFDESVHRGLGLVHIDYDAAHVQALAFEDVDIAYQNVLDNLRDLLRDIAPDEREDEFIELMAIMPFAEYDIKFTDLGDIV